MATKKLTYQRFLAMSDAQKDAQVAEYENGVDESQFRRMTPAQRKRWVKSVRETKLLRRKQGRPVVGKGTRVVAVSIERDLLARADQFAKARALTRAALIAIGLELAIKRAS
jgi:hypothetical protein